MRLKQAMDPPREGIHALGSEADHLQHRAVLVRLASGLLGLARGAARELFASEAGRRVA